MTESESVALPLGDTPISKYLHILSKIFSKCKHFKGKISNFLRYFFINPIVVPIVRKIGFFFLICLKNFHKVRDISKFFFFFKFFSSCV